MIFIKMASSKTIPTTSQPAIGDWIENFERLREQGYTDVIVINLSSGISGSYPSATQAGKWLKIFKYIRLIAVLLR